MSLISRILRKEINILSDVRLTPLAGSKHLGNVTRCHPMSPHVTPCHPIGWHFTPLCLHPGCPTKDYGFPSDPEPVRKLRVSNGWGCILQLLRQIHHRMARKQDTSRTQVEAHYRKWLSPLWKGRAVAGFGFCTRNAPVSDSDWFNLLLVLSILIFLYLRHLVYFLHSLNSH